MARRYSSKAGQYVKKEVRHSKSGKHSAKNRKQAIAIGLNKARKAGAKVPRRSSSKGRGSR